MADTSEPQTFSALRRALATDDMDAIRGALLSLDEEGQRALEERLGADAAQRLYRLSRRSRRGARHGRVIVIHGIMGGQLDSVAGGDADRIWLNYFRLLRGRIEELELTLDGKPTDPKRRIRVAGMFPEYLPLLTELGDQWEVVPFAFDWRLSIDDAATALAERVKSWAKGEPTHIVAHSMGGLVSRRFVQLFPRVWDSMQDPDDRGRGGRLVMLGTPNKGSLAIPLVLTGEEKTVKMLEKLDFEHNMRELLDILGTFIGSYQMLPSPEVSVGDDRLRLFDRAEWGGLPVHEPLLAMGRAFQEALARVIDPDRMIYVAGYNQPTPYRIRIDGPGKFSYKTTQNGDGRVPHELGLLEGVRTFWVNESHGDLPRNRSVLAGIHDLLLRGTTTSLEAELPVRRGAEAPSDWQAAEAVEQVPAEAFSIIAKPVRRGTTGSAPDAEAIDPVMAARYESLILSAYLGMPDGDTARRAEPAGVAGDGEEPGGDGATTGNGDGRRPAARSGAKARDGRKVSAGPRLRVRVIWGDITKAEGDVYVSGHYEQVLPQFAELALDRVVSGLEDTDVRGGDDRLVLTNLTRRGILTGALGHVAFFPWANDNRRTVAIAGMGHPGSFGRTELRRLARNLTWAVAALPKARTVCTVLIGAGVGNMKIPIATDGMIRGLIEALESMPASGTGINTLCIVERDFRKATDIHRALRDMLPTLEGEQKLALSLDDKVERGEGGAMGDTQCLALALGSAIGAAREGGNDGARTALRTLLKSISNEAKFRDLTSAALERIARTASDDLVERSLALQIELASNGARAAGADDIEAPTRLSFIRDGSGISAAAITNTAVVPERRLSFDFALVTEAGQNMTDPEYDKVPALSAFMTRLILPREFRELLDGDAPVVFEVDRGMARVHWEMLAKSIADKNAGVPLALHTQVARQLRTTYSPPPSVERRRLGPMRALVIGDPGDPKQGDSLPGAREEALAVADVLRQKGFDVTAMIAAPSVARQGKLHDVRPASRIEVLSELMQGDYDLLHYAGHGDFDPQHPETVGWLFEGGLITARELERIDLAPRLVVANACLSGLTSDRLARGDTTFEGKTEADLLPGLADEFFRRGVRNYIGTAWEVNDLGAVMFARTFYDHLIPAAGAAANPTTIGAALLAARQRLQREERKFGALWAAYQHYGDPTQAFMPMDGPPGGGAPGEPAAARKRGRAKGARKRAAKRGARARKKGTSKRTD
jgi:hypothetical protein